MSRQEDKGLLTRSGLVQVGDPGGRIVGDPDARSVQDGWMAGDSQIEC